MPLARQALGDAGADPVAAPVDDQYRATGFYLVAQHLPGIHHMQVTGTLEGRPVGRGTGGGNHQVGALALDQCAIDPRVAHHLHACQGHFPLQVGAGAAEFAAPGQQLRQQHLATQLWASFIKGDLVAARGCDGGRLHARWAAACDQDAFAGGGWRHLAVLQFAAGFWPLYAGNRQPPMEMADTRLVAGNAGAHVFDLAMLGLGRHQGVADQRTGHATHVGLAACKDQLCLLGLVDAPGDEQRNVQPLLERASLPRQVRRLDGHGRDDMHCAAQRGRGAGDDVQVVELALQRFGGGQRLIFTQPFAVTLVGADAQADDELLVGGCAYCCQHFTHKPQALFQCAVVAIGTQVDPRVEKLRGQVAVAGHHFDAIEPRLVQAPGRAGIALDDFIDHRLVQRTWHHPEAFIGHRRRRIGHRQQAIGRLHDLPPRVEQLRQDHRAVLMAGLRQAPVAFDAGIVGGHQHVGGVAGAVVYTGHLQHDQTDPASGPGTLVGNELVIDQVVGGQAGIVARGHDAVLQAFAANLQGFEQVGEGGLHTGGSGVVLFLFWL
ncbi:hypothetical protein D3C81_950270 [compost metagenome]